MNAREALVESSYKLFVVKGKERRVRVYPHPSYMSWMGGCGEERALRETAGPL